MIMCLETVDVMLAIRGAPMVITRLSLFFSGPTSCTNKMTHKHKMLSIPVWVCGSTIIINCEGDGGGKVEGEGSGLQDSGW